MWLRLVAVVAATTLTLSSAQQCSKTKKCDTDACCSKWGNCGYGPDFCENGCQNNCDATPECGKWALEPECPLRVCCSKWGFCGTTEDFCKKECQGNCEDPPKPSCSNKQNRPQLNIGYYASWAATRKCNPYPVDSIDPTIYTHLNYAFVDVRKGVMAPVSAEEDQNLRDFAALKDLNPDLKVLASVGGWAFNDPGETQHEFRDLSATTQSRKKFINSVKEFLDKYDFDGIDIDWEYPVAEDRGGAPEDVENYLELVKEMRAVFRSQYLITIAAPASYWYLRHFWIADMADHLDWVNVMTYDIHGVWDADIESLGPYVRPHTDLTEIEPGIGLYTKDGVPFDKLVLGLGYYGRAFTLKDPSCTEIGCEFSGAGKAGRCTEAPGTLGWFEIEELRQESGAREITNSTGQVKILVFDNDQWVGYDDESTLEYKRNWARENCFKGTMIWSIDQGLDSYKRKGSGNNKVITSQNNLPSAGEYVPPRPIKHNQYGKPGLNRGIGKH
ncbi:unnamed protein product [Orchesella dallaii]|uniref:Chitinase n=1 Tax=Orchesella dallaii TaxID=48710 RepID=A0ABP1QND7_9HEXA